MLAVSGHEAADLVRRAAHPLTGAPTDFDPILALVGDARVVLIGEASHGTHEFYRIRAEITKRLIREKGFGSVAVEADWPDAYRVNRYVHLRPESRDADAVEALGGFRRFPQWMWRNADVLDFVGWLRAINERRIERTRVGFYGLDLYALHASIEAVLHFLAVVDPEAAARARHRYSCFDHVGGGDPQAYGYATHLGVTPSCENAVVAQLVDLQRSAGEYARRDGRLESDAILAAEQNARLVRSAERYYRAMFGSRAASWNLRDRHMAETLDALLAFHEARGRREKIVVWAHNSHLGDARATDMSAAGELNVGQLARQAYGRDVRLIGFSTYQGTVTAASDWDEPAERKIVRPALEGSYEALLHEVGLGNFLLDLTAPDGAADVLAGRRLQRAIGVVYRPDTERQSHYYYAKLPRQFDALLHYDTTRAVEPLERTGLWERGEVPETFPSAL